MTIQGVVCSEQGGNFLFDVVVTIQINLLEFHKCNRQRDWNICCVLVTGSNVQQLDHSIKAKPTHCTTSSVTTFFFFGMSEISFHIPSEVNATVTSFRLPDVDPVLICLLWLWLVLVGHLLMLLYYFLVSRRSQELTSCRCWLRVEI